MNQTAFWKKGLIVVGLFFATLLPRVLDLDQYITTDETLWLYRSANFYYALGQREFEHTYQDKHPGVTIMWAGALGFIFDYPEYRGMGQGYFDPFGFLGFLDEIGKEPLELLVAGRTFVALGATITLVITFLILSQLIGELPALIAILLVAFDPFLIALNTILHPDALLPGMMLLSAVAYIVFLIRGRKRVYLIISAVAAAWSWLTKYPGLFLIPYVGLISIIDALRNDEDWKNRIEKIVLPLLLWFLISCIVFVASWPAVWVAPSQTLSSIFDAFNSGFSSSRDMPILLNGKVASSADSNLSFYPLNYLWRSTPIVLLGLVLAIISLINVFHKHSQERKILSMLILFAFFYTLVLSLGGLKADRYIGPIFPILALAAGVGWAVVIEELIGLLRLKYTITYIKGLQTFFVGGLLLSQVLMVIQAHPYYWAYYNPLFGGARKAAEVINVGYGEGLDQAARYLEAQPNASELTVLSWYGTGPFSYYFSGSVLDMLIRSAWDSSNAKRLDSSDYVVTYVSQWQKGMTKALVDTLSRIEPEHIVVINGAEYAKVYKVSDIPPADYAKLIEVKE
jgi:4-amino-4-deoxy-L-arabinose transferase-like glycosyltransferase